MLQILCIRLIILHSITENKSNQFLRNLVVLQQPFQFLKLLHALERKLHPLRKAQVLRWNTEAVQHAQHIVELVIELR